MSSEDRRVLAVAGLAALCCLPLRALAPPAPPLGNAASFAALGGSAVTNSGSTIVTGNLGVSPGSTIIGFPPGLVKLGDTFQNDALAKAAHNDAGIAYTQLVNQAPVTTVPPTGTLPPGTYHFSTPTQLTGVLTLDAEQDPSAVWIFQITGTLTTDTNSSVLAINGAQPGNVFWQISGSATLGEDSAFVGNLIAHDNITLNSHASAFGRLLSLTGTVTLSSNNVTLCSTCNAITLDPLTLPGGTASSTYSQTISAGGGTAPYTFKRISGSLPPGLILTAGGVLSGTATTSGTFQFTVAATDSQGCSAEQKYTIAIACQNIPLSPPTLPDATACVPYAQSVRATGGGGPYVYSFTGLPDGLTPNVPNSGDIYGSATKPGPYVVTVTATDTVTGCAVSKAYPLTVLCNVMISPAALPSGTACALYCTTLIASCGTAPYTFSAAPDTLPAGFTLSPDGKLCVAPTAPGRYTFTVTATDKLGCTGKRTYTVPVDPGRIAIAPLTLPDGIVGTQFSDQTITANCGAPGYRCEVTAGMLPPGLTLTNCKISGTPTEEGCFTFSVTVTDANNNSNSIRYTICVCAITISPTDLPVGSICSRYEQQLTASCGTGPYQFTAPAATLPGGLMLSSSGLLFGTPTTVGNTTFTVTATDSALNTGSHSYTLEVTGGLTLSPAVLSVGAIGVPYNEILTASGGTAPYTFILSSGPPPTGLTLSSSGVISGTPLVLGTFTFCVTVTDSNTPACTVTQCYTITVAAPAGGPALSAWGIVVLAILLLGAALIVIRHEG